MSGRDNMDAVLAVIGLGRWQVSALIISAVCFTIIPIHQGGSNLLSSPVDFRCSDPHATADFVRTSSLNQTEPSTITEPEYPSVCLSPANFTATQKTSNSSVKKLKLNVYATGMASCPEVEYDTSVFESTVISDWHLICERVSLRPLFQMMYTIGSMVGSVIGGYMSDRLGRKCTIQVSIILLIPSTFGATLVPWFAALLALKALGSMSIIILFYSAFTLVAETTPPATRSVALNVLAVTSFIGMMTFGALGYLVTAWRVLWLISNTLFLLVIPLLFLVDESPRWLVQKGRGGEAADVLEKAARQNGAEVSEFSSYIEKLRLANISDQLQNASNEDRCAWIQKAWIYLRSPAMLTILVVTPALWIFQRMIYLGIMLSANNFTGNSPLEYVIISGIIGGISMLLTTPLLMKFKRKVLVGSGLTLCTILLLCDLAVPLEHTWAKWILVMGSFFLAAGTFQINYVLAAELLPTVIRTRGFTLCNLVGGLGELAVPVVTDIVAHYASWGPSVCFGAAGLLGTLLVTQLPETMGRSMPETVQDVEDRYNEQKNTVTKL